jgi:hypothetical protein
MVGDSATRTMQPVRAVAAAAVVALVVPVAALGASRPGKVFFQDTVPSGSSSSVTITTHRSASFAVLLRVPTGGRARLYLLGKHAPKGGPLIRTSNTAPSGACQGAAGSFYCRSSYEPLPRGTYTWRVTWVSTPFQGPKMPAHVELAVRW